MLEVYDVMTSSHWKPSLFVCPHINEKPPFQKSPRWRTFLKRCVFGDHFHRIRVDGRPNWRKNVYISVDSNKKR